MLTSLLLKMVFVPESGSHVANWLPTQATPASQQGRISTMKSLLTANLWIRFSISLQTSLPKSICSSGRKRRSLTFQFPWQIRSKSAPTLRYEPHPSRSLRIVTYTLLVTGLEAESSAPLKMAILYLKGEAAEGHKSL